MSDSLLPRFPTAVDLARELGEESGEDVKFCPRFYSQVVSPGLDLLPGTVIKPRQQGFGFISPYNDGVLLGAYLDKLRSAEKQELPVIDSWQRVPITDPG